MTSPRACLRLHGKPPLDLIEEATHLLRTASAATLATYGAGALPFALGALGFWAEMSRSPFAGRRLAGLALGMALLFGWLKFWQCLFAARLRAQLGGVPPAPLTVRRAARMFALQFIVQPCGLFLLPAALLPILPFAWCCAFFQSATALGSVGEPGLRDLLKRSLQHAALWPSQNLLALLVLAGFAFFALVNWASALVFAPMLLKMFLGFESVLTRGAAFVGNSTFLATVATLAWLVVDPLVKAVYVVRSFSADSLTSGEDLRAELHRLARPGRAMAFALALCTGLLASPGLGAAELPPDGLPALAPPGASASSQSALTPAELDRCIGQVLEQAKYTWRLPRGAAEAQEKEEGVILRFLRSVGAWVRDTLRAVVDWLGETLRRLFPDRGPRPDGGTSWMTTTQGLLVLAVVVVAVALGLLLYRVLRDRRQDQPVAAQAVTATPDLARDDVGAEQLPEDGWTRLGWELVPQGEFRLALRAFYLASLAHLATRGLITLAKFKSNLDYRRELERRGHALPELVPIFSGNVAVFDRVWYGLHPVNREGVEQFAGNVDRLKTVS